MLTLIGWTGDPSLDGVSNAADASSGDACRVSHRQAPCFYVPVGHDECDSADEARFMVARNGTRSAPVVHHRDGVVSVASRPTGHRVAYGVSGGTGLNDASDLWVLDVDAGSAHPRDVHRQTIASILLGRAMDTRLAFADGSGATNRLVSTLADGSGGLQTLMDVGPRKFPTSWSPDGRVLALYAAGTNETRDLLMLHVDGDKPTTMPFVETPFEERGAIFSPDGRWVAYVSNKSGQNDVFARPFPVRVVK